MKSLKNRLKSVAQQGEDPGPLSADVHARDLRECMVFRHQKEDYEEALQEINVGKDRELVVSSAA